MTKRNRAVVNEGWMAKKEAKGQRVVSESKAKPSVPEVKPKTEKQREYFDSLRKNIITIASGHAGSGKGFCAAYSGAKLLAEGKIDKIIITRPYAHLGKDYGATPGTDFEKLEPFCKPILDVLRKHLGEGYYNYCINKQVIEIAPLEKIQGRSFDDRCVLIADETQNATKPQLMSLVTRLGEGVNFLAILGDPRQSIKREDNALDWLTRFFQRNPIPFVGIVTFTEEDCVRSGIVRDILVAFEKEGGFYNTL